MTCKHESSEEGKRGTTYYTCDKYPGSSTTPCREDNAGVLIQKCYEEM